MLVVSRAQQAMHRVERAAAVAIHPPHPPIGRGRSVAHEAGIDATIGEGWG
jgi:hypothetical protein